MKQSVATESYVEGVVEYHQYKDALGLTVREAREHPDTLEVFDELSENVATNPELRLAYIGVLRSRGENRRNAIQNVRAIESDIVSLLYDVEAITDRVYDKERAVLQEDTGIKERAERFVKLFKKVIPPEELPKQRKRTASTKPKKASSPESAEIVDHLGSQSLVPQTQPAPAPPQLPYFERIAQEQAGTGEGTGAERDGRAPTIREVLQSIRFASNLVTAISRMEATQTDGDPGIIWTTLSKDVANNLDIEVDEAKEAVRNLLNAQDLHVVGHKKGIRRISTTPIEGAASGKTATSSEPETAVEPEAFFSEQEVELAQAIMEELVKDRHIERGIKVKSLWANDSDIEEQMRNVINKLAHKKVQVIERFTPRRQNAPHSRRNSEPYIRFTSLDVWREVKDDLDAVLQRLSETTR